MERGKAESIADFILSNLKEEDIAQIIEKIDDLMGNWDFTQNMYLYFKEEIIRGIFEDSIDENGILFPELVEEFISYSPEEAKNEDKNDEETYTYDENDEETYEENELRNLVADIEFLYPPDINESGHSLLIEALCQDWRNLPTSTLRILRSLNVQKDQNS